MRGNLDRLQVRTCAACPEFAVYPRVCGGTATVGAMESEIGGLSPRVRGNHSVEQTILSTARSIPACAGEPLTTRGLRRTSEVYPRVCGGTPYSIGHQPARAGLSPRVRGNRNEGAEGGENLGSIPACAGEPSSPVFLSLSLWVYPRVCGGTGYQVSGLTV